MHSIRETLLSLTEFAEIMGLNPYYLSQLQFDTSRTPPYIPFRNRALRVAACEGPTFEYEWHDEKVSRYEIARAIEQAEFTFATNVGYWPAPKFVTGEELPVPQRFDPRNLSYKGYASPYYEYGTGHRLLSVETKYGYVRSIGTQRLELVQAQVPLTFLDRDNDGLIDHFQLSYAPSGGIDPSWLTSEIALFYNEADRDFAEMSEWEVRPILVEFDTALTTITVTGRIWQVVDASLVTTTDPEPLDIADLFTFVPRLDIWRRTVDSSDANQGVLYMDATCEPQMESICYGIDDAELGLVTMVYDNQDGYSANAGLWPCIQRGARPKRATINYLSGYPRQQNGKMDRAHAQIISWMAAAYLQCLPCGCACGDRKDLLHRFAYIESFDGGRSKMPIITSRQIDNPFGPQRGAVMAWNMARELKQYSATIL